MATGLPSGSSASAVPDPRVPNVGVRGNHFVRIVGSAAETGTFPVSTVVTDLQGVSETFPFDLFVTDDCTVDDVDADSTLDCEDPCLDADGDSYGIAGGTGNLCLGADCADADPDTHQGAPEVNDGADNQCPGDLGFGIIDETSGDSGFQKPSVPDRYS